MSVVQNLIWVVLLILTWANGYRWWRRSREHVARDPELAHGYTRLIVGYVAFGSLPWVVMGAGLLFGNVDSFQEYFQPRQAGPWVLAWYGTIIVLWAAWVWWIFVQHGAETLVKFQGMPGLIGTSVRAIRLDVAVGSVAMVLALLVVYGIAMLDRESGGGEDGFTTVFVVYDEFWRIVGYVLLSLAAGLGTLAWAITLRRRWIATGRPKRTHESGYWVAFLVSGMFLLTVVIVWPIVLSASYECVRIYRDGHADVAQGVVHVVEKGPLKNGKRTDIIEIGGTTLRVGYHGLMLPVYVTSISEGGALREGVDARAWHHGERILRVDVRFPGDVGSGDG